MVKPVPSSCGSVPGDAPSSPPNPLPSAREEPAAPVAGPPDRAAAHQSSFVEVRFKGARKDYFSCVGPSPAIGDHVIVEAERGRDIGRVTAAGAVAERKCSRSSGCGTPTPERKVIRSARAPEVALIAELRTDEERVRTEARKMARQRGLKMKVTDAEWRFDRKYLLIYFTAPKRVDFRRFLPELHRAFRTRVRLEHIGEREEAQQIGGVGRCGRELCCSTWMSSFRKVTLQVAQDQDLFLNPSQISGGCGRLMCCLLHEHSSYVEARRRYPRRGRVLRLSSGKEVVVQVDIIRETVTLKNDAGERRTVPLPELEADLQAKSPGRGNPAKSGRAARVRASGGASP